MSNHIYFNDQTPFGRWLKNWLKSSEADDDQQADIRDVMVQMLEGDGSQDTHYSTIKIRFGFETDAKAREAFAEIDSAYAKTSGNDSVSNVRAARDQLFAKLRSY